MELRVHTTIPEEESPQDTGTPRKAQLKITGMHCAGCVAAVERALKNTPGVLEAGVNLATGKAVVTFLPDQADLPDLEKAVENAGYGVARDEEQIVLKIEGMHCAGCVTSVERALRKVPGVTEAVVNLTTGQARVNRIPGAAAVEDLLQAVEHAGYHAEPLAERRPMAGEDEEAKWQQARHRRVSPRGPGS